MSDASLMGETHTHVTSAVMLVFNSVAVACSWAVSRLTASKLCGYI